MVISLDRQNWYRELYARLRPGYRTSGEIYEALVRQCITPQARVLDLGCGRGGVMELFAGQVALPVGVDPDPVSLVEHREPLVRRAVALADALPFPHASFDLVLCSWVIEHLAHPQLVFSEVARVLRPGGHFVFLTPNALNYVVIINRLLPGWLQRLLVPRVYARAEADTFPVVYRANTPRRLEALLRQAGLQREALYLVGDPSYFALHKILFWAGVLFERLTDGRLLRSLKVHLVGCYVKKCDLGS
ncbi:MAG: class I SAM-dependent methyltransferase [Anaerolineae bacterium]|nr:class I SAM-dependent methyltransferase [Anaerolineae bacterium]